MNNRLASLIPVILAACAPTPKAPPAWIDPLPIVDPFIGTRGAEFGAPNCHPGATTPFGMVQAGPDTTRPEGVASGNHATGYNWEDTHLFGFSHNRLSGVSTPDLGAESIAVVPGIAEPPSLVTTEARTYAFDHADEHAEPGYYSVQLHEPEVLAEVTATTRAAHHRYRFGAEGTPRLVFVVSHAQMKTTVPAAHVERIGADRLEGWVQHSGRFFSQAEGGFRTYFSAVIDPPPVSGGTWAEGAYSDDATTRDGQSVGAVLTFDQREVTVRLALSYVSMEGARKNLEAELPAGSQFDATRVAAADAWRNQLNRVRFEGGTTRTREIFATALYRSFVAPNVHADVDGSYRSVDGTVRADPGHLQHHFFSLWDTYRTTSPLLTMVDPSRHRDVLLSLIQMGREGGALPRWTAGHASTAVTLGSSADIAISEAVLKGVDLPADEALELMLKTAEASPATPIRAPGRENVASYMRLGYVPADETGRSVSMTLEYAIADAAIARLAERLGRTDIATRFAARGRNYATLFDPETKVFRGRNADGSFVTPFDPLELENNGLYYGGNGAQHVWLAPHDPLGIVNLFGTPGAAADVLDAFFRRGRDEIDQARELGVLGLTAPTGYTHHNEPDIHAPYLFLAMGRPDLTQEWLNWIADARYGDGPDGIPGNEDAGGLSAWFVWSAMGLYPAPGQDWFYVGRPLLERIEITRAQGSLMITRSGDGPYVQNVTLDGVVLAHPWIRNDVLARAKTLAFTMGSTRGTWGVDFGDPNAR